MRAVEHPHSAVAAGAALMAVGTVAVVPVVMSPPSGTSVIERAVRPTAGGESIFNIPFNLFHDVVNIPQVEIEAMNELASSLFFSGNWWTPSATNIWGTDPGDLSHYMGLLGMLIPFKQISGLGQPEIDPVVDAAGTAGLSQQLALLAAAELPTSASSAADWSSPTTPVVPITGIAQIDGAIWFGAVLSGAQQFPLFDNWFHVPLSDLLSGYTFDAADNPGLADPSMGVGPGGSVPGDDVFGIPGTHPLLDVNVDPVLNGSGNPINLMPWAGVSFKLNLLGPFQTFYESLLAPTDFSNLELPTITDFIRALQSLLASAVVAYDPYIASSLAWFEEPARGFSTLVSIVQAIGNLFPGNTLIDHWLDLVHTPNPNPEMAGAQTGLANMATPHQLEFLVQFTHGQQFYGFDFGNPPPWNPPTDGHWAVDTPAPFDVNTPLANLIQFMQDSGIQRFVHLLADLAGYTPVDYGAGDASGSAADLGTWFAEPMNLAE